LGLTTAGHAAQVAGFAAAHVGGFRGGPAFAGRSAFIGRPAFVSLGFFPHRQFAFFPNRGLLAPFAAPARTANAGTPTGIALLTGKTYRNAVFSRSF
jgi:hypothetical protein